MTQSLTEQLKSRLQDDQSAITEYTRRLHSTYQQSLERLESGCLSSSQRAQSVIESDMRDRLSSLSESLDKVERRQSRLWIMTAAGCIAVALLSGVTIWGLSSSARSDLERLTHDRAYLEAQVERLRSEMTKLRDGAGIEIVRHDDGQSFLTLPSGMQIEPGWTLGGKSAARITR